MARILGESRFESSGEYFETHIDEAVGVIDLKGNVFEMATDLPLKETFFSKIRSANLRPEIKVLLITSGGSALGEEKYVQFDRSIRESTDGPTKFLREENALSQYIRLIYGSDKIVVSGVRGSVVSAFLGAILAADYRVASESTLLSFLHLKYEMSPQGGLGFFLPRYLGVAKARKILYSGAPISAAEAYELGLVDDVVADHLYESKCMEIAKRMSQVPTGIVRLTKRLIRGNLSELDTYLKMESELSK
jgi:enoyl-CoA hydratase/carnithine racemase